MYDIVLFDLDGIITESESGIFKYARYAGIHNDCQNVKKKLPEIDSNGGNRTKKGLRE